MLHARTLPVVVSASAFSIIGRMSEGMEKRGGRVVVIVVICMRGVLGIRKGEVDGRRVKTRRRMRKCIAVDHAAAGFVLKC